MRYMSLQKLPLFVVIAMLAFYCQASFAAEKEADDLEEALMMKLLEKRAKKRVRDDDKEVLTKTDLKLLKTDDKPEISATVVNDIKGILKEPCLNLLASSELISWPELADRVSNAKKAFEMFEVKYKSELASGGENASPVAAPGKPVAVMPGMKMAMMPGAKPTAAKKASEDGDDDDDEDEDEKPAIKAAMPMAKPAGMPGITAAPAMPGLASAAGMPMAKPAGMPGVAPAAGMPVAAPAMGGMPMAR